MTPDMSMRERVIRLVYMSIEDLNQNQGSNLARDLQTSLRTSSGVLDSLGITMFLVDLERRIESELGKSVPLVSGTIVSEEESPLRSVGHLVDYIAGEIEGHSLA